MLQESTRLGRLSLLLVGVTCLILRTIPAYCQFADLPQDTKTVDIGVNGGRASQTLSLTAVVPLRRINGWTGIFGSRASGEEGVLSEIVKARAQGGFRIGTFGIEGFTDLERDITKGTALTSQIGSYIRPAIYEKGTLRVSGGIGCFLENIQPHKDLVLTRFDPTTVSMVGIFVYRVAETQYSVKIHATNWLSKLSVFSRTCYHV